LRGEGVKSRRIVGRLLAIAIVGLTIGGGVWLLTRDGDSGSRASGEKRSKSEGSSTGGPANPGEAGSAEPVKRLAPTPCPPDLSGCVSATGRVLYVEKVDPDGDGDAHFVTASGEGVTGPGITIFDVRADLRPDPLPGIGDLVGGAGPVYPGHAGQKQIEVVAFEVAE